MRRKRVCVIADAVDEPYAGVSTYAKELIRRLPAMAPDLSFTFLHMHGNPFFEGLDEIRIPLRRGNPFDVLYRKCARVPGAVRRGNFDLVHDLFHFPPFAFRDLRCAKVVTVHDITPILHPAWHTRTNALLHRLFLPRVLGRADRVIADSAATARDLQSRYGVGPERLRVVHLAAKDFPAPPPDARRASPPLFLFVGTLEPRKNLPVLVDAFERLRADGCEAKLALVGKRGWRAGPIFDRISASPRRADIAHLEGVDDAALAGLFREATAFVYPSLYEGFGLPVLEAMRQGVPVVTSDRSSLPEVAGDAAILVDPEDPAALAEAMRRVLDEAGLGAAMAQAGLRQAQRFSWERCAEETLATYREALATDASP